MFERPEDRLAEAKSKFASKLRKEAWDLAHTLRNSALLLILDPEARKVAEEKSKFGLSGLSVGAALAVFNISLDGLLRALKARVKDPKQLDASARNDVWNEIEDELAPTPRSRLPVD